MKVCVAGGRSYRETAESRAWLETQLEALGATCIVCGCASGADEMGRQAGIRMGIAVMRCQAEWAKYGPKAGPMRNRQMAEISDVLIAFPGGAGTANMRANMQKLGGRIILYPQGETL